MRYFHLLLLVPIACLATFSGCGGSPDSLMKQQISLMNDMADAIENNDEAAIKSLESRAEALKTKMEKIDLSASEKKRLAEKYQDDLAKAGQRLMAATMGRAMGEMGKAMGGMAMPPGLPAAP